MVKNKSNRCEKKRERERKKKEERKTTRKKYIDQYHDRLVKGAKNKNLLHRPNILKFKLGSESKGINLNMIYFGSLGT